MKPFFLIALSLFIFMNTGCKLERILTRGCRQISKEEVQKENTLLEKHLKKRPKHIRAIYVLGMNYYGLQDFENSIKIWDNLLKIAPKHTNGLFNRGLCKSFLNRMDEANQDFQRCVDLGFDEDMGNGQRISEYLAKEKAKKELPKTAN